MLRCFAARSARTAVTWMENRLSKSTKRSEIINEVLLNEAVYGIKALPLIFAKEGQSRA
jgi:hypothetical protein